MYGYTTKMSIDLIDEICDNPSSYSRSMLQQALNDAEVHYRYGNASKSWFDSVERILNSYL
ncbi:MAG: hypothetical protein IKO68_04955 [Oscillospiraceae bacterium]|nr:hypothetical protein [Oscillospiraceae bacterium]MBR7009570.1 hypothetical protein [Oscillospiraceae bacterium]